MRSFRHLKVLPLLATAVTVANGQNATNEPCAAIAQAQAANSTSLDPDVALACLKSVPVHADEGVLQVEGIKSLLQFQSTLGYLKDPPAGYYYPAVDMTASLDGIASRLRDNEYSSEWDLQLDIYKLIVSAYDAHLVYTPDILAVFSFQRSQPLLSLSADGVKVPAVYLRTDVLRALSSNGSTNVPEVLSINGQDAQEWLNEYGTENGQYHDPDANYNALFPNSVTNAYARVLGSGAEGGIFTGSSLYQGNATTLGLDNGTTVDVSTFALTQLNFTGVTDGRTFYDKFCTGSDSSSDGSEPSAAPSASAAGESESATPTFTQAPFSAVPSQTTMPGAPGFPDPFVVAKDYTVVGYLAGDTAVLSVRTFELDNDDDAPDFQSTVRELLASAKSSGSKQLILDVRGNGGGSTFLAHDVFKQIFPSMTPTGTLNVRAHPLVNDLGEIYSDFFSNVSSADPPQVTVGFESPLNVANDLKDQETPYADWAAYYGPVENRNGNFTNLFQYNLTNPPLAAYNISGYGSLAAYINEPVFSSENILLLTDGACGSACSLFAEFVKSQGHVRSVVFGGRQQTGPMQAVGNTKGAQIRPFSRMTAYFDDAVSEYGTPEQVENLNDTYPTWDASTEQAILRSPQASLNYNNNIRVGDDSRTPLQFVYEAADCRLFYTASQLNDQSLVWKAAANAIWGNGSCVAGSTGSKSSGALVGEDALIAFEGVGGSKNTNGGGAPAASATPAPQTGGVESVRVTRGMVAVVASLIVLIIM